MKSSSCLLLAASVLLVLICKLAFIDAAPLINQESSMIDENNSASDEDEASLRSKKNTDGSVPLVFIPKPFRRHHLKFGVLGKRYTYGYLGKRDELPISNSNFENWLEELRERRAGRPQYGLLG